MEMDFFRAVQRILRHPQPNVRPACENQGHDIVWRSLQRMGQNARKRNFIMIGSKFGDTNPDFEKRVFVF